MPNNIIQACEKYDTKNTCNVLDNRHGVNRMEQRSIASQVHLVVTILSDFHSIRLICISLTDFVNNFWYTTQHLMIELDVFERVIYLENFGWRPNGEHNLIRVKTS